MNAHKNDTLVNTPKITFGMIVLNGEPFIGYNLRALYPYAYQIIVVEGAALSAKSIATPDGHSTDNTRETIRKFQEKEDIEHKVALIQMGFGLEKRMKCRRHMQNAQRVIICGRLMWMSSIFNRIWIVSLKWW
jgi:hypothetical protein